MRAQTPQTLSCCPALPRGLTLACCLALTVLGACSDAEADPDLPAVSWTELRPGSTSEAGKTRFTRLDPATSGLTFEHRLDREHILPYLYNGAGVAVGDYNGDQLPDIYLVSQDGPNKLFRQTKPWQFEDVTEAAGGLDGGEAWGNAATFVDIDNDGDLDLYVCNLEAPNLLYQNRGDGTFREVAGRFGLAISAASTGAAFADYDNDGDLDLYLLTNRVLGPSVPIELAEGMRPPKDTRKGVSDFLPSGRPGFVQEGGRRRVEPKYRDLYFTLGDQVFAGGQSDRLYRQDGYAQFQDVSKSAGIQDQGMGLSATWWDFDDDGHLDLYVANDLESPDVLYHNRGDGTFEDVTKAQLPHTAYFGMGSDFGDIDGDGDLDFCVADMSSRSHYMGKMLMGNMGDRRWFLENSEPPQVMRNALYLNTGGGRPFLEGAFLAGIASTNWTWSMRFADLDNDTRVDLFATNGIPRFDNNPDANPEFLRLWRQGKQAEALDYARSLPPVRERNLAFRNLGQLEFEDQSAAWGLDEDGVSHGTVLADLDRDGDLDVVINNFNAPASLYRNDTSDGQGLLVELRGGDSNRQGVGSKVTLTRAGQTPQIRILTLARGYLGTGEAVAHFGTGSADSDDTEPFEIRVRWPNGRIQVVSDARAGRHYILSEPRGHDDHTTDDSQAPDSLAPQSQAPQSLAANSSVHRPIYSETSVPAAHREALFDDYAVQPLLPRRLSRSGPGAAWGDANGDGRDDLFVGGAAGQAGKLLIASDAPISEWEELGGPWSSEPQFEDQGAVWIDFDSDGDRDLYVVSGGVEIDTYDRESTDLQDRLYENLGGQRFAIALDALPTSDTDFRTQSGSCVAAADFDRDGDLDLFVGGHTIAGQFPAAPTSLLLRNDAGTFVNATQAVAPELAALGMVTSAVWTDLNADGFVDLAIAAHYEPLRVLFNREGTRLAMRSGEDEEQQPRGLWNGMTSADLDDDGDFDLVVTNLGQNSKYHASEDHPVEIFADDFGKDGDSDGVLDVVEAKHGAGDALLPVRGKSCSSEAMPFLNKKFRTFDAFARATLPDIYSEEALEGARYHVRATELSSGVFENQGDGSMTFHALPKLAQIAPGYGVVVTDVDGDGAADIVMAHNSFSPEPETGRMDGGLGLVLLGSASSLEFRPMPIADSGFARRGDQKSLSLCDGSGNGTPDLLLTVNNERPSVFSRGIDVGRGEEVTSPPAQFGLRLIGKQGNLDAIGARVYILGEGDKATVLEVHAGDSYLAQSSPTLWLNAADSTPEAAPKDALALRIEWPSGVSTQHDISLRDTRLQTSHTLEIREP